MTMRVHRRRLPRWVLPFVLGVTVTTLPVTALITWVAGSLGSIQTRVFDLPITSRVFESQPGPDMPTLQTLGLGAADNAELVAQVAAYYDQNAERLAGLWRIDHPTRLAATFAMYLSHISQPYGAVNTLPETLIDFVNNQRAHCGTYTLAQREIAAALGVEYRSVEFVGEHAWLEVKVDGEWEIFDATTNIWISKGIEPLLAGEAREYRGFYTPMLDANRPDARLHIEEGFNMQRLRDRMPLLGINFVPPGELIINPPSGGQA